MLRLPPVQGPDDEEPRGEPMNSFPISLVGVVDLFRRSTIPRQSSEMVRVRWRGCERRGTQPFVTLFLSTAFGFIYLFFFLSLFFWDCCVGRFYMSTRTWEGIFVSRERAPSYS
ncbi:uncharacterized protein BO95DRAFT_292155 [Aspergillus brunneoviolaceus CBS 621.78]|uniref:Uncharacterized protein n=1 Tax=Aspergillus brunneoviolaceus CBS 621.78 TaxID=1450534 RepID=A0ACD1FUY9_9EURO|nr:hypothetical protein BO95DRAFT_292155 [Aspergillus brunneoviolaceus CBS 621.78]RAH40787.1 hypothetical protein BO95DRAFT_292155 [Aspergillus brunneoviolaceus CBS 621.78]